MLTGVAMRQVGDSGSTTIKVERIEALYGYFIEARAMGLMVSIEKSLAPIDIPFAMNVTSFDMD
jgi:hypothetical protein